MTDSGTYYVVVTHSNGTSVEIDYTLEVAEKATQYAEVGLIYSSNTYFSNTQPAHTGHKPFLLIS